VKVDEGGLAKLPVPGLLRGLLTGRQGPDSQQMVMGCVSPRSPFLPARFSAFRRCPKRALPIWGWSNLSSGEWPAPSR